MSYLEERRNQKINGKPIVDKKKYSIPKKSQKKIAQEKAEKEARAGADTELQKWYKDRQKELTGICIRCHTRYNKSVLHNAICATAHVLPKEKNKFPSIALHPDNFIELPAYCGCHHWYDNQASWEEIKASPIWPEVLAKFKRFESSIKEKSKIPDVFLGN